ncbi:MAG: bL35 family ribosomal protein [Patescibacteria group bacterium]|jgi:large subunit ribosomal protein L35
MPKKMKTHQGTAKRIQITKGGKMKRRKAFQSHNLEKKSAARKRPQKKMQDVAGAIQKKTRRLLAI